MAQDTAGQAVPGPPSTQNDLVDLKVIVGLLTKLVEDASAPRPATAVTTNDTVEASDTVFRYRLLTALIGGSSLDGLGLVTTVSRVDNGLEVANPAGKEPGANLSLMANEKPFKFTLSGGRVTTSEIKKAGIDVLGPFDAFVVRSGPEGRIIAVAPALAAITAPPTAS